MLQETTSDGHRFKIIGLTTATHELFHMDYIVREGVDSRTGR